MDIYVLLSVADYEGEQFDSLHTTLESAQETASNQYGKHTEYTWMKVPEDPYDHNKDQWVTQGYDGYHIVKVVLNG